MIKAVVFDLDDTLISELDYVKSGFRHISNILSLQLRQSREEIYNQLTEFFSEDTNMVFNRLFDKLSVSYTEDDILKLVDAYRSHMPEIKFYEDVLPVLDTLKQKNIKTGIITDGYAITQRNKLQVLQADEYFDHIIVTDELGRSYWKPNPLAFELMKEQLNVEFDEMMYVGDNPAKDFYIAARYPVKTVRIIRNSGVYTNTAYLHDVKEFYKVKSLYDIRV